jgi:hypothetical protein
MWNKGPETKVHSLEGLTERVPANVHKILT